MRKMKETKQPRRINVQCYTPEEQELYHKLRVRAAEEGVEIKVLVWEAIRQFLAQQPDRPA